MEFGILGPLEVGSGDDVVAVPGVKQRVLLAELLLHVGEVVSVDRLVNTIWGDEPPANPKNALQSQISQLRRHLRDQGQELVVSQPPAYVLRTDPDQVDAVRFERLVRDGRAALRSGDEGRAADLLSAALKLWRGSPLVEFVGREFADVAAGRLEELRLGAVEDRIECDLRAGRHGELVPELEALVADHPLRERLCGQLMLALARAGRQADALEVFHHTRRILDEELGIDPGRELVSLYETLLRQEDEPPAEAARQVSPAPAAVLPSVLPRPLSSFVGRDDDLDRIVGLLAGSRLVTLTGPGGVGKTRLAVEAAACTLDAGPATDGVWLVELAGLQDPDLLADTVADTMGLADEAGLSAGPSASRDAGERVLAVLRHRRALLVLDNCEHVLDGVAAFARDLLGAAPELTVLCTSREALGLTGETVWSVPSLVVPPPDVDLDPAVLERWGASALFLDRVRDADPDLVIDDADARTVAEVCRRLDGIPLALELAAARVRTLGLGDLADRLDHRFLVLTGGDRTAQPRQQTLQAVIDWSWNLLDDAERTLFRRLAVFAGRATLDAIEEVCGDPHDLPGGRVVEVVASLVDKSMLVADRRSRPARYRMLESLHAYAADRLATAANATPSATATPAISWPWLPTRSPSFAAGISWQLWTASTACSTSCGRRCDGSSPPVTTRAAGGWRPSWAGTGTCVATAARGCDGWRPSRAGRHRARPHWPRCGRLCSRRPPTSHSTCRALCRTPPLSWTSTARRTIGPSPRCSSPRSWARSATRSEPPSS